jgi:hypothetical protein
VPEVLPPAAGGVRPVPSFAGVAVLPLKRSLYASTLSQLSALSASFGPASLAQPQVQACRPHLPASRTAHACMLEMMWMALLMVHQSSMIHACSVQSLLRMRVVTWS